MDRRGFLRAGSLVGASVLSGCGLFGPEGGDSSYSLSLDSVDSAGLAEAASLGPADFTPEQRRVVAEVIENTETRTYGRRPIADGEYVEYEGEYYRVTVEETGTKAIARPTLSGEAVNESDAEDAVEIDRYTRSDRQAVEFAVATADESGEFYVLHSKPSETDLLPEPEHEYLQYYDRYVRLVVEERLVTEQEYTYTLEQVAASATEFASDAVESVVTASYRPAKLSGEQNEILRRAIEDEYTEFSPVSERFRDLLERLGEDGDLPDGSTDTHVEYDGEYYRAQVTLSMA
jgi:hypothetical protein